MRRDSSRYGNFPKRQKSRERPWNRASPAFGKLWEHAGKCRVDLLINLSQRTNQVSGFFCSYDMFKYIFELMVKMSAREQKDYYVILISVTADTDQSILFENSNGIKKIIGSSLRNNDVFAKVNDGQFVILVDCQNMDNAYLIIQRISKKFYNRYRNKGLRMHYESDVARFKE